MSGRSIKIGSSCLLQFNKHKTHIPSSTPFPFPRDLFATIKIKFHNLNPPTQYVFKTPFFLNNSCRILEPIATASQAKLKVSWGLWIRTAVSHSIRVPTPPAPSHTTTRLCLFQIAVVGGASSLCDWGLVTSTIHSSIVTATAPRLMCLPPKIRGPSIDLKAKQRKKGKWGEREREWGLRTRVVVCKCIH